MKGRLRMPPFDRRAAMTALTGALRRAGTRALGAVWYREPPHQVCPECSVDFVPGLTDRRCPICGWLADAQTPRPPRTAAPRGAVGLGAAWFVGLLVFLLIAHALYS